MSLHCIAWRIHEFSMRYPETATGLLVSSDDVPIPGAICLNVLFGLFCVSCCPLLLSFHKLGIAAFLNPCKLHTVYRYRYYICSSLAPPRPCTQIALHIRQIPHHIKLPHEGAATSRTSWECADTDFAKTIFGDVANIIRRCREHALCHRPSTPAT